MSTPTCRLLGSGLTMLGLAGLAYGVVHAVDTTALASTTLATVPLGRGTASIMMLGLLFVLGGGMTMLGHRR